MPTATLGDKVTDLNVRYRQRLEGIVANSKLTDEGKRRKAVGAWAETVDQITELREANGSALEAEKRKLHEKYLGPPKLSVVADANVQIASIAAFRDGLDRAERAEGRALGMLIARAHKIGDESQVKAGLFIAFERNDVDAINAHLEHKPEDEPDLQHLIELSASISTGALLMAEFHLGAPEPPFGLSASDARRLLETAEHA